MTEPRDKLQEVEARRQKLFEGGGAKEVERQHKLGKLTARERLARLFDPGTFQELNLWICPIRTGFDVDDRDLPGDAVVTGMGLVNGRPIYAYIHDFTVLAGAMSLGQNHKVTQIMEKALRDGVPYVGMVDSGGIKVHDLFGRPAYRPIVADVSMGFTMNPFSTPSVSSGVIPQISLMIGPCYAGSAYSPISADFVIMRKGTSYMSLASPQLLKTATHVDVTQEQIGGAELHAKVTGSTDFLADTDEQAIEWCRGLLSYLPLNNKERTPRVDTKDDPQRADERLLNIVSADSSKTYDMHDVISRVVDDGRFFEIQSLFARNLIVGFARMAGEAVGIVANNPAENGGALDYNTCDKQSRFVRFCDDFNIPLVFLVDTPGFLPSVEQEKSREGLIRTAARAVFSVAEATVPRIVIYVGRCFGTARLAMGTLRMGVDDVFAWHTSRVARMDPLEAVRTIYKQEIAQAADPAQEEQKRLSELLDKYVHFPYHAGEYLMVEDIIDPRQTRPVICKALRHLSNRQAIVRPWKKSSLMPR